MNSISLVNYSSSESEESEDHSKQKFISTNIKLRYPVPKALIENIQNKNIENHIDKPEDHEGRCRNFKHERGNWTTYGFISFPQNDSLIELQEKLKQHCEKNLFVHLQNIQDLHISISKTVVLRHHWIDEFIKSVKSNMIKTKASFINLNELNVYLNDEKTRTFIGLCISPENVQLFYKFVELFDFCLKEFNLPEFYKHPSFHVSILWSNGDKYNKLKQDLPKLNRIFKEIYEENLLDFGFNVTNLNCQIGNKVFHFSL